MKVQLKILSSRFFGRPTLTVARELLGKFLVRQIGKKTIVGMITEVEAYVGPRDRASHASRGRTPRTEVMFGPPGHWYVYLIYGMHYCLNIVTEKNEYPAAVLIRAVLPVVSGRDTYLLSPISVPFKGRGAGMIRGPGRVCRYFKVDKKLHGTPAIRRPAERTGLWIEDRGVWIPKSRIRRGPRIGVDYAGKWKEKKWRFWVDVV